MTWWQTLLIASVPAAITAVGLLVQQRLNAKTERLRIAEGPAEREHQRALAQDVRQADADRRAFEHNAALDEHWRERRLQAHEGGIRAVDNAIQEISEPLKQSMFQAMLMLDDPDLVPETLASNRDLPAIAPEIGLLGSTESSIAFRETWTALNTLRVEIYAFNACLGDGTEIALKKADYMEELLADLNAKAEIYRQAAKNDLGTV